MKSSKEQITRTCPCGFGHWKIVVTKDNYSQSLPYRVTSTITWTYVTSDSVTIDAYFCGDDNERKRAEILLKAKAKYYGVKTTTRYK